MFYSKRTEKHIDKNNHFTYYYALEKEIMVTKKIPAAQEKEVLQEPKKNSLTESSTDIRKEAGAIALSAEARVDSADFVDTIPGTDVVSERISEDKRRKSDPGIKGYQSSNDDTQKTQLPSIQKLQIPSQKVMIRKVRVAIQKEIQKTKQHIKQLDNNPTTKAFELSQAVDLLRKLYGMLQEISYKSAEFVKNIWIHISQGKQVSDILK